MALTSQERTDLKRIGREIRETIVDVTGWSGGAHIGGSLSMTEIVTILYWKYLRIDPKNPKWEDRDRFVLSKGHGGVGHGVVLCKRGFFDFKHLEEYNHTDSMLGMHLDSKKVPGVEVSTGSMGHGLGEAVGLALGARVLKKDWRVYCVIGDGESNEGSIWEAAMAAAHYKLSHLIGFLDRNRMMIDGPTEEVMSLEPVADKWKAFGWNTRVVDGHDLDALADAIEAAQAHTGSPTMIVCNTVKGKGVKFMEDDPAWHYGGLNSELVQKAKASIAEM
ncbi:MAG TPA: transketolase [Candidatus Hydrogenedentes bacterium]|nr:transketolase [Candidatus Hydrogenedentota bacterium]